MSKKKKKVAAKAKPRKRLPSPKTGRRAGKQPLVLGEQTVKSTLYLAATDDVRMKAQCERKGHKKVASYLRELVMRDLEHAAS